MLIFVKCAIPDNHSYSITVEKPGVNWTRGRRRSGSDARVPWRTNRNRSHFKYWAIAAFSVCVVTLLVVIIVVTDKR